MKRRLGTAIAVVPSDFSNYLRPLVRLEVTLAVPVVPKAVSPMASRDSMRDARKVVTL